MSFQLRRATHLTARNTFVGKSRRLPFARSGNRASALILSLAMFGAMPSTGFAEAVEQVKFIAGNEKITQLREAAPDEGNRGSTYRIRRSVLDEEYRNREPLPPEGAGTEPQDLPSIAYDNRRQNFNNAIRVSRGEKSLRGGGEYVNVRRNPARSELASGHIRSVRDGIVYMSGSVETDFSYGSNVKHRFEGMQAIAGAEVANIQLASSRHGFQGYKVKRHRINPTNKGYSASRGYRGGDHRRYYSHRGGRRGAEYFVGGIVILESDNSAGGMRQIAGDGGMTCDYGEYCTIDLGGPKIITLNDIGDIKNGELIEQKDK